MQTYRNQTATTIAENLIAQLRGTTGMAPIQTSMGAGIQTKITEAKTARDLTIAFLEAAATVAATDPECVKIFEKKVANWPSIQHAQNGQHTQNRQHAQNG